MGMQDQIPGANGKPRGVPRPAFLDFSGGAVLATYAASNPAFAFLRAAPGIHPLLEYPDRDWERTNRDQYAYDDSFTFVCAPNDTHQCRLRAFRRNGVVVRIERNYDRGNLPQRRRAPAFRHRSHRRSARRMAGLRPSPPLRSLHEQALRQPRRTACWRAHDRDRVVSSDTEPLRRRSQRRSRHARHQTHPTDHLPARHTRADITREQHAEDHGELHHPAGTTVGDERLRRGDRPTAGTTGRS
jgi:hypothetical protein